MNAEKCSFLLNKVVFLGLLLSKHGIGPTEEKVKAVVDASEPQTPSEVRSFLGLVGLSARFISPLLLIPLGGLQEKENRLCGMRSKRSHFRN